jgi:hypothetical protein
LSPETDIEKDTILAEKLRAEIELFSFDKK